MGKVLQLDSLRSDEHRGLQQRLQVVVSGIDGLRRGSFPSDETYERFQKLVTATKILPARGNEGRLAPIRR
jgi:hypothetical protein